MNKDNMKNLGWAGMGFAIICFIFGLNWLLAWFDVDFLRMIGVAVVIDEDKRMMFYLMMAVAAGVNVVHHASDRYVNLAFMLAALWMMSGGKVGVEIDASGAAAKAAAKFNEMQTGRNLPSIPSYTPAAPHQPAQSKQDTNAYYNIYKRNTNSGKNYSACMNWAMAGQWNAYVSNKCNTGAPLERRNIATCNDWHKAGSLTKFQSEGCGFTKPSGLATWCTANVGQPGQQRAALCRG